MKCFMFGVLLSLQGIHGHDLFRKLLQYDTFGTGGQAAPMVGTAGNWGSVSSYSSPGMPGPRSTPMEPREPKVPPLMTRPTQPMGSWPSTKPADLMCPGPAFGCFKGHLRHCTSATMKQDEAKIIRACDRGCKSCGEGQPDVCITDRFGAADVCATIMQSKREERVCMPSQNGVVGCFNGPDVGYCFQSKVYMVDFCGDFDCKGSSRPDQCNTATSSVQMGSTSVSSSSVTSRGKRQIPAQTLQSPSTTSQTPATPQNTVASTAQPNPVSTTGQLSVVSNTALSSTAAENMSEICMSDALVCFDGHIRLCMRNMPKQFARVMHDCRSQGCSRCENGPDLCNGDKQANMCSKVTQDLYTADCRGQNPDSSYCDNDNVRVCEPGGRGILAEFCDGRSCQKSPAQCIRPMPATELCQGNYVHCYQGNIRQCKDKQPLAQSEILHNCRSQGCSPCPGSMPMCNNEQRESQCNKVTPDRLVTPCAVTQSGTSFCANGDDMRHCNSSGLAFVVEFCDTRGCQTDHCNPPSGTGGDASTGGKGGKGGKAGKGKGGKGSSSGSTTAGNSTSGSSGGSGSSCGSSRVRSEWGATPDSVRAQYVKAVNQLYANGDMVKLAQQHYDNRDQIHGNGVIQFFIWHRVFLNDFEERLRALPGFECLTVPYWNYDYSNNHADRRSVFGTQSTKLGQGETADCIGGAFASVTHSLEGSSSCIRRSPNRETEATLSNSIIVDLAQIGESDFMQFASNLQNAHGYPHVTYGATFATHYSPIDPLFFVHHANIDRIWDMWQDCHNDYQWYEPAGLDTPIIAYNGVTAADFIDNSQYRWKGNSYSVKYSSDQFGDPSVYSSDFRRSVLTRCVDGKFRRYDSPNPVLGADDVWSRATDRSFEFQPGSTQPPQFPDIKPKEEYIPLSCSQSSGTSDFVALKTTTVPIAVYDNFDIQECVARCDTFYWKKSGVSNCVCMQQASGRSRTTANLNDASIKRFAPTCGGGDANYGLYQIGQQADPGRRLQARDSNPTGFRNDADDNSSLEDSSENLTDSLEDEQDNTLQNDTRSPETEVDNALNETTSISSEGFPWNDTSASDENATESGQVCFDVPSTPRKATAIVCSSRTATPVPLPREWLVMNKLNPDSADACKTWKPAVGSKSINCVHT